MERVTISGQPCLINLEINPQATLEAKEFIIDSLKDELQAGGGIKLTSNGLKLTSGRLLYNQKEDMIYFMPSVFIAYQDSKAQSGNAAFNIKNREITLTDNAQLLRLGSRLTGDKVLVSLIKKTFKVIGKTKIIIPSEEVQ